MKKWDGKYFKVYSPKYNKNIKTNNIHDAALRKKRYCDFDDCKYNTFLPFKTLWLIFNERPSICKNCDKKI